MSYWNNLNLQIGASPYITTGNVSATPFRGVTENSYVTSPNRDSFQSQSNQYFLPKNELEHIAKSSDVIKNLSKEYNFPIKINIEELEKLQNGHLKQSRVLSALVASNLPENLKREVDSSSLQLAAMLHDYGKVLIPQKILNKEGSLEGKEKEIMQLHSILGYELLKQQGVDNKTLNLIKYHHQNSDLTGYPEAGNDMKYDIASQILRAADEYSALTEERSYKPALSREDALNIINEDVEKGYISQEVFDSLKRATA